MDDQHIPNVGRHVYEEKVDPMGRNWFGVYLGSTSLILERSNAVNCSFNFIGGNGDLILDVQEKFLAAIFSLDGSACGLKEWRIL